MKWWICCELFLWCIFSIACIVLHIRKLCCSVLIFQAPYHLDDTADIANLIDQHQQLNLQNGLVVAVPVPDEHADSGIL